MIGRRCHLILSHIYIVWLASSTLTSLARDSDVRTQHAGALAAGRALNPMGDSSLRTF